MLFIGLSSLFVFELVFAVVFCSISNLNESNSMLNIFRKCNFLDIENCFQEQLDSKKGIELLWNVDYQNNSVHFEVHYRLEKSQNKWLGIGFSDRGEINNADLCFAWIGKDDKQNFQHVWTDENSTVSIDRSNNYCLLSSIQRESIKDEKNNEHEQFVLILHRTFNTGNPRDYVIEEGTTHIIYVTADNIPQLDESIQLDNLEHNFKRVLLFKSFTYEKQAIEGMQAKNNEIIQISNYNVQIPNNQVTTQWCSFQTLPIQQFKNKTVHLIGAKRVISPKTNYDLLHHIQLFLLEDVPREISSYSGECEQIDRQYKKVKTLVKFGKGIEMFAYPPEAGIPLVNAQFILLQIHYNNPLLKKNVVDNSGIQLYYTEQLRPYEAGQIWLDEIYTYTVVPPKQKSFRVKRKCNLNCKNVEIPNDGITIFALFPHTHELGRKVWFEHWRENDDGKKEFKEYIYLDAHYDTYLETIRLLRKRVKILPGDEMIFVCQHDSTYRPNITIFGDRFIDGMCTLALHYYSSFSLNISDCWSSIELQDLNEYFDDMKVEGRPIMNIDEELINEKYRSISWTEEKAKFLQNFIDTAKYEQKCI